MMRRHLPVTGMFLVAALCVASSVCLPQVITEQDFKLAPRGMGPRDATPASPGKPHVDYDTVFVDRNDPNKIFGNWRNDASSACREKTVTQYQLRNQMTGYTFESTCHGSKGGIWNFTFQ